MRKLIASEWITLDGVFDGDTINEWFNPYHSEERAAYIQEGYAQTGAFILGRETYDMLMPYWSARTNNEMGVADTLNNTPKYVVSSTLERASWQHSTVIRENVVEEVAKLKQQPGKPILIIGSATLVRSLLQTNLIDELWFLVQPIIMGIGKRFFGEGTDMTKLNLMESRTLQSGVVLLRYRVAK